MPVLLSCKSASAMDTLPRKSNLKRSTSAFDRLQQRKQTEQINIEGKFSNITPSPTSEYHSLPVSPAENFNALPPPLSPRKNFNALRHKRSSKALSLYDLPPASSDSNNEKSPILPVLPLERVIVDDYVLEVSSENSEDEDEQPNKFLRGIRSQSFSPSKANRLSMYISNLDIRPTNLNHLFPSSPRQAVARKRKVKITTIGNPTNFQHTSHLGVSSFNNAIQKEQEAQQMARHLSDVTAALKMDEERGGEEIFDNKKYSLSEESSISEASSATTKSVDSSSVDMDNKPMASMENHLASVTFEEKVMSPPIDSSEELFKAKISRQVSRRKPVPKPRELADLCDVFKDQILEDGDSSTASDIIPLPLDTSPSLPEKRLYKERSLPTIGAKSGKRLVQGPAGDLITDTANGRWNCALDEIKKALKSDEEDYQVEVDEDVEGVLQKADVFLTQLDAL